MTHQQLSMLRTDSFNGSGCLHLNQVFGTRLPSYNIMIFYDSEFVRVMIEDLQNRGLYAGFWDCHDKQVKEADVVYSFLEALFQQEDCRRIKEFSLCDDDPPDCIGITEQGGRVAFEVTELVDESMIRRRIGERPMPMSKRWRADEIIGRLQAILDRKCRTQYARADFDSVILVIHTAEPSLDPYVCEAAMNAHKFIRRGQFDEAYLLFPLQPLSDQWPCFRLPF